MWVCIPVFTIGYVEGLYTCIHHRLCGGFVYLYSQVSSCSCFSVCRRVTGQPLEEYLQGNITVVATFSMARFLMLPTKKPSQNEITKPSLSRLHVYILTPQNLLHDVSTHTSIDIAVLTQRSSTCGAHVTFCLQASNKMCPLTLQ